MRSNQKTSNRVFVDIESMGDMRDESKHGNESARSKATPKSQTTTSTLHNAHMNDATYESRIGILAHGASPICKYATAERKFQMENHGKQGIESENGVDVDTNAENTASTSVKARSKHASNANPLSEIQHAHVRKHADITWTKHSDDYIAPLISLTELLREDEKFVEYKRSNITFDTYSVIPLFGFLISVFITRGSVMDSFSLSAFFSAAFVLNILALVGFTVAIYILLSERFSNPNLNSAKKKKRVKSATTATDRPYSDDSDVDVDVDSIEAAGDEPRRSLAYNKFFMQIVETTVYQESFELLALTSTMAIGKTH